MTNHGFDPEAMKQGVAAVFDRSADTYDQVGVDFFRPAARDLVARARLREGERVLDLGTGRGAALFAAAEAVGPRGRVVGIDLSPRMAELTQADAQARGLENVTVLHGDAEDPQFGAGAFDAVLASLVIFFLPNAAEAANRYRTLLAPGGRLAFTTFATQDPNLEAAMRAIGEFVPGENPERSKWQGQFGSRQGIVQFLTENGYAHPEIDEMTYESRFADPDHWIAWVWSHGGGHTLEQLPADRFDEAVAAGKAALEAARTPAGDYAAYTQIRFTIARPA